AFERRLDLDFGQANSYDMIRLISDATDVPILVKGDIGARVNLRLTEVTALAALDEILAQAGAKRSESSGLRVVRSTPTPAPLDGGEPFSADFADAELSDVLRALEPKLGMAIVVAGDVPPTRVTIKLDNVAAGAALAAILNQADLAVERVTALEVTPDVP
ncbi:MAG TPA: hypothetical protein VIA18_07565, partial [Polyangia bacterium]|nr:hypothetical protein [Polyangia bacterium]